VKRLQEFTWPDFMYDETSRRFSLVPKRDKQITVMLSDDEHRMLAELAAASGLDMSSWLRTKLRRDAAKRLPKS
jgi:Mobilization protein NikA